MEKMSNFNPVQHIRLYDGYRGEDIWKEPQNNSTYYNYQVDKQCGVPLRSREELLKELGIE